MANEIMQWSIMFSIIALLGYMRHKDVQWGTGLWDLVFLSLRNLRESFQEEIDVINQKLEDR